MGKMKSRWDVLKSMADPLVPDSWERALGWNLRGEEGPTNMGKLEALEEHLPTPQGVSPRVEGYMRQLSEGLKRQPGAGYKQGPYYKSMLSDIAEREKARGYTAGSSLASRGGRSTGAYGAGRAASTDRADAMDRLRLQAASQAQQATARDDLARYDSMMRAVGFEEGISGRQFQEKYIAYLQRQHWTNDQINLHMEEMNTQLSLWGSALKFGYEALTDSGGTGVSRRPGGS